MQVKCNGIRYAHPFNSTVIYLEEQGAHIQHQRVSLDVGSTTGVHDASLGSSCIGSQSSELEHRLHALGTAHDAGPCLLLLLGTLKNRS